MKTAFLVVLSFAALVGAGTTASAATVQAANAAAPAAAGVRTIETLSAAERASLPDATQVVVLKRMVTLGQLRAEHAARLARFASAPKLGLQGGRALRVAPTALAAGSATTTTTTTLVPGKSDPLGAADYQSFCQAANATACLFIPPIAQPTDSGGLAGLPPKYYNDLRLIIDVDPLITDPSACASGGGFLLNSGCAYPYPTAAQGAFAPGQPSPGGVLGSNVSVTTQGCGVGFANQVDPRGSFMVGWGPNYGLVGGQPPASTCVIAIMIAAP
jgi:hypothetical protein